MFRPAPGGSLQSPQEVSGPQDRYVPVAPQDQQMFLVATHNHVGRARDRALEDHLIERIRANNPEGQRAVIIYKPTGNPRSFRYHNDEPHWR